nr:protein ALP1-like isoform X1 [Tanacetum cinerariifolium]
MMVQTSDSDVISLLMMVQTSDSEIQAKLFARCCEASANNDINVLGNSPLFYDLLNDTALVLSFVVNSVGYEKGYYLADGIYPQWATFVKSFTVANDAKHAYFKKRQEGAWKDVERAFGVLQGRWGIIQQPARSYHVNTFRRVMYSCIILHNMILKDQKMAVFDWNDVYANPARNMQRIWIERRFCSDGCVGILVGYCVYKMDLSNYEVPRVLVTCRSKMGLIKIIRDLIKGTQREELFRNMVRDENENENVPLYYHMLDNFQIQFEREDFCLVIGLKFGVEYWADYNDEDEPIPFRRRVFLSSLDGKPITEKNVEELIKSKSFSKLDDDDAVSLCYVDIGGVSRRPNEYYTRHRRYPRVVAWSSNKKFYRNMLRDFLHGRVPAKILIPDEIEAISG